MIVRYAIDARLPFPARTALHVVQTALGVNRSVATRLIHDGAVICRGRAVTQTHLRLNVGDILEIEYSPQPERPAAKKSAKARKAQAASAKFEVVHDEEHFIVVNKPAGLLTVPTPNREKNTLLSQVSRWMNKHQASASQETRAFCVHRLDRGVSGLLVLAKDLETCDALKSQFAARKPQRRYVAIVRGRFTPERRTFQTYMATDKQTLNRYSVADSSQGELAITHARVREYWRDLTLLTLQLETGRRNQIRVHLAEAGHPILGDPRYRPNEATHPQWPHRRIALHAETLGFNNPVTGESLAFECPWPQEFRDLRRKILKQQEK